MHVVKGKRAVEEALNSQSTIERIVVDFSVSHRSDIQHVMSQARSKGVKVQVIPKASFQKSVIEENAQGIIAYVRMKPSRTLDQIVADREQFPRILVLDHIHDPHNFGAILRSCEVFGFRAVIYPKDRNCQLTPSVIKASAGAVHHLELVRTVNIAQALMTLDKAGYWLYAADSNQGQELSQVEFQCPAVLVVGSEQKGISKRVSKMVHLSVKIPMIGNTASLNVSVATGIMAYEMATQRMVKSDARNQ